MSQPSRKVINASKWPVTYVKAHSPTARRHWTSIGHRAQRAAQVAAAFHAGQQGAQAVVIGGVLDRVQQQRRRRTGHPGEQPDDDDGAPELNGTSWHAPNLCQSWRLRAVPAGPGHPRHQCDVVTVRAAERATSGHELVAVDLQVAGEQRAHRHHGEIPADTVRQRHLHQYAGQAAAAEFRVDLGVEEDPLTGDLG